MAHQATIGSPGSPPKHEWKLASVDTVSGSPAGDPFAGTERSSVPAPSLP